MKSILFVCVENACRSQMAEGFAKYLGPGVINAYSAGSKPAIRINLNAVEAMWELNINISFAYPKGFDKLPLKHFDYVVTMGCGGNCPVISADRRINWNIEDPRDKDIEIFRKVRDNIKDKMESLIEELAAKA